MDFDKTLEFATNYLSDYFWALVATLRNPIARFSPLSSNDSEPKPTNLILEPPIKNTVNRLNPKLFGFIIISIFFGTTINALIPNRKNGPDFITSAIVIIISWFIYSTILHLICKALRGKGHYEETLSVSLQLLSVLYVVSNFLTLMFAVVVGVPQIQHWMAGDSLIMRDLAANPVYLYFIVEFILSIIYLPLALHRVHRFNWKRQVTLLILSLLISILSLVGLIIAIALYISSGMMRGR